MKLYEKCLLRARRGTRIGFAILATICFVTPSLADVIFPEAPAIPTDSAFDQNVSIAPETNMLSKVGATGLMTIAVVGLLRRKQRRDSSN